MGGSSWPTVFCSDVWLNCNARPDLEEHRIEKRQTGILSDHLPTTHATSMYFRCIGYPIDVLKPSAYP